MFRNMKLRTRILVSILSVTLVAFVVAIGFVTVKARKMAMTDSHHVAEEMAYRYASNVETDLETALDTARSLANTFEGTRKSGLADRHLFDEIMKHVLEGNSRLVAVWSVWEPDALDGRDSDFVNAPGHDGTGRYVPYWHRSGSSVGVVPLENYDRSGAGDYYLLARNSGRETITEPYFYEVGGRKILITSLAVPIRQNGTILGVAGVDLCFDSFRDMVGDITPYETGFASLLSNKGEIVTDGNSDHDGMSIAEMGAGDSIESIASGKVFTTVQYSQTVKSDVLRYFVPIHVGETTTPWSFAIHIPLKRALKDVQGIVCSAVIIGFLALVVLSLVVLLITRSIVRPVEGLTAIIDRLSTLDLTFDKSMAWVFDASGEVGQMAKALGRLQEKVVEMVRTLDGEVSETADGAGSLAALSEEQNASMEEIRSSVDNVADLSESNSASLQETNASIEEVASGAQSAAQSAEKGAEAVNKMAREAGIAAEGINLVIGDINMLGTKAGTSSESLARLADSVDEIAKFVATITAIADQTNLLALNAAIEAARAGDAGRGFAVVADEVRKLAEESNRAAHEVAAKISSLQEDAGASMSVTSEAGEIVNRTIARANESRDQLASVLEEVREVEDFSRNIASVSEEQAASSEEMTSAVQSLTEANAKMVEMIENIRNATDGTSSASENVATQAQSMSEGAEKVKVILAQFRVDEKDDVAGLVPLDE